MRTTNGLIVFAGGRVIEEDPIVGTQTIDIPDISASITVHPRGGSDACEVSIELGGVTFEDTDLSVDENGKISIIAYYDSGSGGDGGGSDEPIG